MRFEIDLAVMDLPEQHGRDLNAIIDTFARGQHRWSLADPEVILASRWVANAASWDAELPELVQKTWRAALDEVDAPSSSGRLLLVALEIAGDPGSQNQGPVFRATPEAARRILEAPVYLVLEDATSDWHFLKAIARSFERALLLEAIDRAWLVPEHGGGGGGIVKRIDGLRERGVVPWRIVALMDSDRLAPGPLPPKVAKTAKKVEDLGAVAIVLFKREIENYLPSAALGGKRTRDVLVSFLFLTQTQRDHFDMKSGFQLDGATQEPVIHAEQVALYAGTNPWHLKRLVGGFGDRIGDRFKTISLDRDELSEVCATCPGEIERIVHMIEEVL